MRPTILAYGTPKTAAFFRKVAASGWGLVLDNGSARDVVFTMYENFARADALVLFPNAHPAHLVSVIAEAEVGHPLILQQEPGSSAALAVKPIIFFGGRKEWAAFRSVFDRMQAEGLLRDSFDRAVTYCSTWEGEQSVIEERLPSTIPSTRIHYYIHTRKQADLAVDERMDVRPPSEVTVACFGSASTKNERHLERTGRVACMLARNNWNILHGGGTAGVMGQLSRSGAQYKAYVTGVTVHASGAPKISFERANGDRRPDDIDQQIASKDMLHRIETYAGHSQAFVSLDGGIGSVQEILIVAELLTKQHPAVTYISDAGKRTPKPLLVLNESGCYSPFFDYLRARGLSGLVSVIQEVKTVVELEAVLSSHFRLNPPQPLQQKRPFRELYALTAEPRAIPEKASAPAA